MSRLPEAFIPGRSTWPEKNVSAEDYLYTAIQLEKLSKRLLTPQQRADARRRAEEVFNMAVQKELMEKNNMWKLTND